MRKFDGGGVSALHTTLKTLAADIILAVATTCGQRAGLNRLLGCGHDCDFHVTPIYADIGTSW